MTISDVAMLVQAIAIVALAAAVVFLAIRLTSTTRELGEQRSIAANARADQEHLATVAAERQADAAREEESDTRATLEETYARAAESGGRLDAGALYDAGVHEDSRDPDDGDSRPAMPDRGSATAPAQGAAAAGRVPGTP